MGDAVLALFGYPQAHEDDAHRAVRTGLGMVEAVEAPGLLALQWHPEFQDPADKGLLDGKPILREFLDEVRKAK